MTNMQALLRLRRERDVAVRKARTYHRGVRDALGQGERTLARELGRYAAHHRKQVRYYAERCAFLEQCCK